MSLEHFLSPFFIFNFYFCYKYLLPVNGFLGQGEVIEVLASR